MEPPGSALLILDGELLAARGGGQERPHGDVAAPYQKEDLAPVYHPPAGLLGGPQAVVVVEGLDAPGPTDLRGEVAEAEAETPLEVIQAGALLQGKMHLTLLLAQGHVSQVDRGFVLYQEEYIPIIGGICPTMLPDTMVTFPGHWHLGSGI